MKNVLENELLGAYLDGELTAEEQAEVERLLAEDRLRPAFLFEQVHTRRVAPEELTDVDPNLDSLTNVNTPEDHRAALGRAELDVPPEEP